MSTIIGLVSTFRLPLQVTDFNTTIGLPPCLSPLKSPISRIGFLSCFSNKYKDLLTRSYEIR